MARPVRAWRWPVLAGAVGALNAAAFVAIPREGNEVDRLVRAGAKATALVLDVGELWRLLIANFIHKDVRHLAWNLLILIPAVAALEQIFEPLDAAALLLAGGGAGMAASLWISDAISLGASAMLYAALAALAVFALRERASFGDRWGRVVREGALPLIVILLGLGWTSPGVDRGAHAGGMFVGALLSPWLRVRLFADARRRSPIVATGLLLFIGAVLSLGAFGFERWLPLWRMERDDGFGISLPVPKAWGPAADPLGKVAYSNGLPGYGRATFAAEAASNGEPVDATAAARRLAAETLTPGRLGDVQGLRVDAPVAARIGAIAAWRVSARYATATGQMELDAFFVPRGALLYQLTFTRPAAFPRYARVEEQMLKRLELEEPRSLREARAQALLLPGSPERVARLSEVLRQLGEVAAAAALDEEALGAQPSSSALREQLARAQLSLGRIDAGCETSRMLLEEEPNLPGAHEVAARCQLARAKPAEALRELELAQALAPGDERISRALQALRAEVAKAP